MVRRDFLKSIIAAVACAAIPIGLKKPLSLAESAYVEAPSPYEEVMRANALTHMENLERAFLFGTESVETKFGTVTYKTHSLFT